MAESNSPLNAVISKERFVYPSNPALKESYIALLGLMKLQKKIRFYVSDCIFAIVEQNGWITEYNPGDPDSKQDKNWKRAKNYLKVLEDPYFRFVGPGVIEIRAFDVTTKRQVTNFEQFFGLCAEDTHMAEYTSCDEEVIFQEWDDVVSCNPVPEDDIVAEIRLMDSAIPLKADTIKSTFETTFDKYECSVPNEHTSSDDIGV